MGEPDAAAFGRLCVETGNYYSLSIGTRAAAFGRLCVETHAAHVYETVKKRSRLRAAVC